MTERAGIVEAGVKLGSAVVASLGPQFLALLLINAVMLALLYWYIDARAQHTVTIVNQLLAACLQRAAG